MLTQKDYSDAARVARIASNKYALERMQASCDTAVAGPSKDALVQTIAQFKASNLTPVGQGLPSTNENPHGWTDNSWDDPAFAGWISDANGLLQPPPYVEPPKPIAVLDTDVKFEEPLGSGKWFIFSGPFRFQIRTTAPESAPKPNAAAVTKGQVMGLIRDVLKAEQQTQPVIDAFQAFAIKVNALPE